MTHQKSSITSAPIAVQLRKHMILLLAALFAVLISAAPQAVAQKKKKESFGDWEINCGKPPGSREEKCALVQSVIDEERPNLGLRVVFLFASGGRRVLRTVVPLGVLLPFGLGLRIDDEPIGKEPLPFIRCHPMGCISEIIVKDKLLDKFKSGTTALFIIVETKEEGRAIPVSLKGFSKGLERLTALAKTN